MSIATKDAVEDLNIKITAEDKLFSADDCDPNNPDTVQASEQRAMVDVVVLQMDELDRKLDDLLA